MWQPLLFLHTWRIWWNLVAISKILDVVTLSIYNKITLDDYNIASQILENKIKKSDQSNEDAYVIFVEKCTSNVDSLQYQTLWIALEV